jgi:hypothetical protein
MQMSGRFLCLLLVSGLLPVAALAQKPAAIDQKVDAYVLAQIASQHLAGVSVSVVDLQILQIRSGNMVQSDHPPLTRPYLRHQGLHRDRRCRENVS